MKQSRGDFGQRGNKKSELKCSPKKRFDPTINFDCSLSVEDVSAALKQVCDESLVFTTEMKQPTEVSMEDSEKLCTLDDFFLVSTTAISIDKSYFVVWTAHDTFAELIEFDKDLWETSKNKLTEFYFDYYVPSLFLHKNVTP